MPRYKAITIVTLIFISLLMPQAQAGDERDSTQVRLDAAWQKFSTGLSEAQRRLTAKEHAAPLINDRNLAEGYRYLLAHIARMIELEMREDSRFPEFHRSMSMLRKWTAENPDTAYLKARIDAQGLYRVSGTVANHQEWKTSERNVKGRKAPRMVTFQTITDFPGATGELKEMQNCRNQTLEFLNSFDLTVGEDGHFEFLIGPARPDNYNGDFLLSKKEMHCPATKVTAIAEAKWLAVREIFSDWEYEVPLDMDIQRLDSIGASRPPIDPDWVAQKLAHIGDELPKQIRFWNMLQEVALEMNRDVNGDGKRAMPINAINQPALPFTAGGVAGAKQLYAAGIFELEEDQALLIKVTAPIEPHYVGFQLGTAWFEGPDQQNYVSSLSGQQLPVSSDGSRYYIVARKDPGYQGWVDTTGFARGTHSMRFIFKQDPDVMPTASAKLVILGDLAQHLPKDTPTVSLVQRKAEIAIRQRHIKMRWREY